MSDIKQTAIEVRVRYCECDPMNVAHHSVYPIWLEMARTELLREHGSAYRGLEEQGVFFVVIDLQVRYRRPARYDDVLRIVASELPGPGGRRAKVEHAYQVLRGDELLATAATTLACVNRDGRPMPIPDGTL